MEFYFIYIYIYIYLFIYIYIYIYTCIIVICTAIIAGGTVAGSACIAIIAVSVGKHLLKLSGRIKPGLEDDEVRNFKTRQLVEISWKRILTFVSSLASVTSFSV